MKTSDKIKFNIKCTCILYKKISLSYRLCLEWNALGMLDNSFSLFCEGLGSNECLQALDLRNNQINHDCAIELSANLKRNKTLRAIGKDFVENYSKV